MFVSFFAFASGFNDDDNIDNGSQDVWLPNLRGIPLGRPGDTVAEFVVKSSSAAANRRSGQQQGGWPALNR